MPIVLDEDLWSLPVQWPTANPLLAFTADDDLPITPVPGGGQGGYGKYWFPTWIIPYPWADPESIQRLPIDDLYPPGPFPPPVPLTFGPLYAPDRDAEDVIRLHVNDDDAERAWQSWVWPRTHHQNGPLYLPDAQHDVPKLYGTTDDDALWSVSGSKIVLRVIPSPWSTDDAVPQPVSDEDSVWQNWVLPRSQVFLPLYLPDADVLLGSANAFDEDAYWQNWVGPLPQQFGPLCAPDRDAEDVPPVVASDDDAYWSTWVALPQAVASLSFIDDLPGTQVVDDDLGPAFGSTVVVRVIASPWSTDESVPLPLVPDESEAWQNWVPAVPQQFGRCYLPDAHEGDVPTLSGTYDEDLVWSVSGSRVLVVLVTSPWSTDESVPIPPLPGDDDTLWQNWVPPVSAVTNSVTLLQLPPWVGGYTEDLTSQLQEDFLVYLVQDDNLQGPLYRPDSDEQVLNATPDEDQYLAPILTQLGLRPYVYAPPIQPFTDTEEPLQRIAIDEDYYVPLPFLANLPLGVPAYLAIIRSADEASDFVPQPTGAKDDEFLVLHIGPRLELTLKGRLKFRVN